uniref:HDC13360 n=1 Tax=Drosophila melanogaster TaxID=7227 RepID=Q6IK52_DROME|nr:TPA_inf: HDC13360 [Drosophila melanogaster]
MQTPTAENRQSKANNVCLNLKSRRCMAQRRRHSRCLILRSPISDHRSLIASRWSLGLATATATGIGLESGNGKEVESESDSQPESETEIGTLTQNVMCGINMKPACAKRKCAEQKRTGSVQWADTDTDIRTYIHDCPTSDDGERIKWHLFLCAATVHLIGCFYWFLMIREMIEASTACPQGTCSSISRVSQFSQRPGQLPRPRRRRVIVAEPAG